MKLLSLKAKILLAGQLLLLMLVLGLVSPHKAKAINSTTISSLGPITSSANTDPGNTAYTPWMAVGVGAYNGPESNAKAYAKVGAGTTYLSITQASCQMQDVGAPQTEYWVFPMYTKSDGISEGFTNGPIGDSGIKGPGTCGQTFKIPLSGGVPSTLKGHSGWMTFYIMAIIWNSSSGGDTERSFRLSVDNGGVVGLTRAEACSRNLTSCDPAYADSYTGIYSRNLGTGVGVQSNMWDYAVQFGARCGESVGSKKVTLYDMDPGVYSPQNLGADIQRDNRSASGFSWSTIAQKSSFNGGSGNYDDLNFTATQQDRYRLIVSGVNWRNTLQLYLPYDQFDAQTFVGQSCNPPPADAYCTTAHSPTSPQVGKPVTMTVNLHNTSAATGPTFNSNWQVRQVSPGGMAVGVSPNLAPGKNEPIGPFNINPRSSPTTVTFTYQLFDSNGTAVGSSCSNSVTWVAGPPPGEVSCSPDYDTQTVPVGKGAAINITLFNNTGKSVPGTYQLRQVQPGGQAKSLGTALADNDSVTLPTYTINARSSPTTVDFYYTLFTGPNAGSPAIPSSMGPSPLCHAQISWIPCSGSGCSTGGPAPYFTVSCTELHVYNLTSTATSPSAGASYQTYQQPDNYPATPYVWASPPPPAGSPFLPGVPTYTYTPIVSGTATTIPLHFHFSGSDGSSNDAYFDQAHSNAVGNPITDKQFDTFNDFSFLWPHIAYTITLEAQTAGDVGAGEAGPYTYNQPVTISGSSLTGGCLDAACGNPGTVDAEPGQTKSASYGMYVYNYTNKTFSSNDGGGYHFGIDSDNSGIVNVNNVNASPDISPGNPTTVNVNFTARFDYTGTFWSTMYFGGSPISLPSLNNPCPPGSVTPASRAYFEVRGADIATGGGFRDINDVCASTAPGYISPATGYSAASGAYDYAGGIRAYGNQNGGRGSSAEYGVLSLGLTIGQPTGPVGFFSRHNEVFANTGVPNAPNGGNLGGYLSPSGATDAHCVDDYFTKTRLPGTTPTTIPGSTIDLTGKANGQYQTSGSVTLTSSGCGTPVVGISKQITLYVNGNLTINNDICYAKNGWDPTDRSQIPYLAIIVSGNITLTGGVNELDGLYVAQPDSSGGEGIFNTCDTFCANQLVVYGAVIAQQLELNRAHGTMGPIDADVNNLTTNPAELFNYVPSMIIGTPNFKPLANTIEALFSLPPVF